VIVETESYPGNADVASHHHHGKLTDRTKVIFSKDKGLLYVYSIYGLHYCFGITSGDGEENNNVTLIRAIEPIFGIEEMKRVRETDRVENLLSGPAKIAEAFAITKEVYGWNLLKSDIIICDLGYPIDFETSADKRIGIGNYQDGYKQSNWRYYIKGSKFLSR
jgi:DNA-3-methyladenine glycosylase